MSILELNSIFKAIKKSAVDISKAIQNDSFEYTTSSNSSGDNQLKIDVKSDLIIENYLKEIETVKALSSEEKNEILEVNPEGKYTIAYDPLDGSSLVDVNLSVGSIFGIYQGEMTGENMIASVYVVYGPRLELVTAFEKVEMFRYLDGEFRIVKKLELGEKGKIQATGATQNEWSKRHKTMIDDIFSEGYRLRYSGGMVPDLHQILLKEGGIFTYPSTTSRSKGKLRLLYEVFPFAFIFEKAGGVALDENLNRVLEVIPESLHDTSPCFFTSKHEVKFLEKHYAN
jgi:fructose-1,6-bisphosphatase I